MPVPNSPLSFKVDVAPSLAAVIDFALAEDGALQDITSTLALDPAKLGRAVVRTRESMTLAGVGIIELLAKRVPRVRVIEGARPVTLWPNLIAERALRLARYSEELKGRCIRFSASSACC